MEHIPVAGPWITSKEIDYVTDAAKTAWYSNANKYHTKLEKTFCEYATRSYALALPSCTSAIHLTLLSLNLQPGDEVIVPEATWIATAAPISYVGATPIFADIDPTSWCLSPDSLKSNITPKTKAVIVVDLYGNMPNFEEIVKIAKDNDIAVIEDAAQSLGATYRGLPSGHFGLASVASFHGSKTVTSGEGGILLTDDRYLYENCLSLMDHGRDPLGPTFLNNRIGYKYKMSSMQAALAFGQLERIQELVARKRQIYHWYESLLGSSDFIKLNNQDSNVKNAYWMTTAIISNNLNLDKEYLANELKKYGIDTRPFFYPLSSLPAYSKHPQHITGRKDNPTAYHIAPFGINLPSAMSITYDQVKHVSLTLKHILSTYN